MDDINDILLADNSYYPYVKPPKLIETYLKGNTPCLYLTPLPVLELEKIDYWGYLRTIILILSVGVLILFKITNIVPYIIIIFLIVISHNSTTLYQETKQSNKTKKEKHLQDVEKINKINNERKFIKESLNNPEKIKNYCQNKIYEISKDYTLPEISLVEGKKGLSEFFFLPFLIEYFENNLKLNFALTGDKDFIPDFVIQYDNICIDIEIDEPYTKVSLNGRSGNIPIHYYDDNKNSNRDDFFVSNNWCVIRFAEEQILLEPLECCKFIIDVITKLAKFDSTRINNIQKLDDKKHPKKIDRWSREDATEFFKYNKRRDTYVKAQNLALKVNDYPKSCFSNEFIFVTKLTNWNNDFYQCIKFVNSNNTKIVLLERTLFPSLKEMNTIEIDLKHYKVSYKDITETRFNDYSFKSFELEYPVIIISQKQKEMNLNLEESEFDEFDKIDEIEIDPFA